MTYEEKLLKILEAIQAARKNHINNSLVKLYITKTDGLDEFDANEIYDILYKVDQQNKVLKVNDTPSYIMPHDISDENRYDHQLSGHSYFTLELFHNFDDW